MSAMKFIRGMSTMKQQKSQKSDDTKQTVSRDELANFLTSSILKF